MYRGRQIKLRAFSLIEMMAVMVLLAMMLAIAVPAISSIGRTRAGSELQRLAVFIRKNVMHAMRHNVTVRVLINMNSGEYWAEESSDPVSLFSSPEDVAFHKQLEEAVAEEIKKQGDDPFEGKGAASGKTGSYLDMLSAKAENEDLEEDFYNWENFIPKRVDLRALINPRFDKIGKKHHIDKSLLFTEFFSYQSLDVATPEEGDKDNPAVVAVYLFSSGKMEPFYVAIGDKTGKSFSSLGMDFFMKAKIHAGGIGEDAKQIKEAFKEDEDAEGKS